MRYRKISIILLVVLAAGSIFLADRLPAGKAMDQLNGVTVYSNGLFTSNISGRNQTADGYNIGLKYQCVEFIKRYYYQKLNHKMPDPSGDASDFFAPSVADGQINPKRNLRQFSNPSHSRPQPDDLLVFGPSSLNRFGHVAIVAAIGEDFVELVQQNPGLFQGTRERLPLRQQAGRWEVRHSRLKGWLRCK